MKVTWASTGRGLAVRLERPESFDGFAVEVPDGVDVADIGLVARPGGDREEVDVPADLVRGLAGALADSETWSSGFEEMLHAVAGLGWYDERTRLIRAHVVRV